MTENWHLILATIVVGFPIMVYACYLYIRADYLRIEKELHLQKYSLVKVIPYDKYLPPTLADRMAELVLNTNNRSRIYCVLYHNAEGCLFYGICETASFRGVAWHEQKQYFGSDLRRFVASEKERHVSTINKKDNKRCD